ncbi:serine/threonine-protein kinase [Jatrophihabitans sp. GAS493]|uniref:Stk1 family PASTA domain-containing Ser/Thr kinase n=1 Tax=Jatrophihabitans sp. GAS493 TaxID=1907575 RepID=UPI000BB6937F|nr:Stk1 family PASTA domain-containing Ser/Thr kinase [Jatrophihabitans sp. GAS493]SOD70828.1 serine/threonine-protein kinase [Jatrophihabitans sp. GAS493]
MTQPRLIANRYELGELIGYGGMAEVHRGRDVRLGREVAIKVLRADLARDQTFLNRFRREAQAAAGLNHPAIVAVYDTGEDVGTDGPIPYIVMEYVSGRTLRDVLKAEGRLPAERAMQVSAEICAALDFSHRNGIVHRDIKPANVMITEAGAVKVMDFGIARALSDNSATVTQTAAVIGTAQYLSPEQARGESVDARSDVYSTGCLLYELITGHPPFTGDSPVAVAYQHVRETAPSPSSVDPTIPRALDSIVMKALAKNPLNRYQSAAEMRSDLQRALADLPVEAEAVLTDDERTQLIAKTPVPVAGAAAVAAGGDGDPLAEEEPKNRRAAFVWLAVVAALLIVIGLTAYLIVFAGSDKPKLVAVPNIIAAAPAAADNSLLQQGFKLASGTHATASKCGIDPDNAPQTVAVGNVCTQTPLPNSQEREGTVVTYTVYAVPTVAVLSVVGKQLSDASNVLAAQGLTVTSTSVDNAAPAGQVVDQNPKANTSVPTGSTVQLSVSSGKVPLPNVVGMKFADARQQLTQQGWLAVNSTPTIVKTSDKSKDGLVSAMNPQPGISYTQATPITLTVYQFIAPTPTCAPSPSPAATPLPGVTPDPAATPTPTVVPPAPGC